MAVKIWSVELIWVFSKTARSYWGPSQRPYSIEQVAAFSLGKVGGRPFFWIALMAYLVIFPLLFARLQTPPTTDVRRAPNVRSQESLIHRKKFLSCCSGFYTDFYSWYHDGSCKDFKMVFCYVKNTCTRLAMARVYYSVYYGRLVMGRVYYGWLWEDMKALVINTHETDLKL